MISNEDFVIEKSDNNKPVMKHFHNVNEIVYIESGSIDAIISGEITRVDAPSLLFINNLDVHSISIIEIPYVRYFMLIPNEILHHMQEGSYLGSIFIKCLNHTSNCINVSSWKNEIDEIFTTIYYEFSNKQTMFMQFIVNNINCLLIKILRRHPNMFVLLFSSKENTLYKAKRYIENNYIEKISIDQIASQFFISTSFLTHSFKIITGMSPKHYLMSCRLAHSRDLLRNSEDCIMDIAINSGFKDVNNFIRYFKKEVGISPLKYRKNRNLH